MFSLFLDLPLITGDEVAHAPYFAATADPWPGAVALYQSPSDSDYRLLDIFSARSVIGVTQTPLSAAPSGRIDEGAPVRVKLTNGALSSVEDQALLSGANLAAIGDGTPGNWELFQFANAELADVDTYLLSRRLRGQLGSDGVMPDAWPAGSWFVLMNGAPEQIDLARNLRRVSQSYRIGPGRRPVSDPSYLEMTAAFDGNGLRPYRPVHLAARTNEQGAIELSWVRRTRVDGDAWDAPDVPLGEETERYLVRVIKDEASLREETVDAPNWIYPLSEQLSDGLNGDFSFEISQISATYGPGPSVRLDTRL